MRRIAMFVAASTMTLSLAGCGVLNATGSSTSATPTKGNDITVGVLMPDTINTRYTNFDYPINVGGRPLYALSAFMVVCFELTILFAALAPAIGMLALNGLPRLNHPVFDVEKFHRASRDRFFLCVLASDEKFDPQRTRQYLRAFKPLSVELVKV